MLGNNVVLRDQILVVMAGRVLSLSVLDIPFEHQFVGFLMGDAMLAAGYQAADVFVNASIEDAGPMMINESILCGTPGGLSRGSRRRSGSLPARPAIGPTSRMSRIWPPVCAGYRN